MEQKQGVISIFMKFLLAINVVIASKSEVEIRPKPTQNPSIKPCENLRYEINR